MRISGHELHLDVADKHDGQILSTAKHGISVRFYQDTASAEDRIETRILDFRITKAFQAAYRQDEQLPLFGNSACAFTPRDIAHLTGLVELGLEYQDGIYTKRRFRQPTEEVGRLDVTYGGVAGEAQFALPFLQAFANQPQPSLLEATEAARQRMHAVRSVHGASSGLRDAMDAAVRLRSI